MFSEVGKGRWIIIAYFYYQLQIKLWDLRTEGRRIGKNPDEWWNPNADLRLKENELTDAAEQRRSAALLWFDQVDAAALVDADTKVDSGGRARVLRRREEEGDEEKGGK